MMEGVIGGVLVQMTSYRGRSRFPNSLFPHIPSRAIDLLQSGNRNNWSIIPVDDVSGTRKDESLSKLKLQTPPELVVLATDARVVESQERWRWTLSRAIVFVVERDRSPSPITNVTTERHVRSTAA